MSKTELSKHFPAEIHRQKNIPKMELNKLFLYNKKVDAVLYTYYQDLSVPVQIGQENGKKIYETRVWKEQIPSDAKVGQATRLSRSSIIRKRKILIDEGFLEDHQDYYVIKNPQSMFFPIPLRLLKFFIDTASSGVIKTYIYLGQSYKYANSMSRKYLFTKEQIIGVLGLSKTNQSSYEQVENILNCLINNGLIEIQSVYKGKTPMKKLVAFHDDFISNPSV